MARIMNNDERLEVLKQRTEIKGHDFNEYVEMDLDDYEWLLQYVAQLKSDNKYLEARYKE